MSLDIRNNKDCQDFNFVLESLQIFFHITFYIQIRENYF